MKRIIGTCCLGAALLFVSCEEIDHTGEMPVGESVQMSLGEVAEILSCLEIGNEQVWEVRDAVGSSSDNGYDDEYTMRDLFSSPGTGVGDSGTKAGHDTYVKPLRELFEDYFKAAGTKADGGDFSPEDYMKALSSSDIQIYWPYHEDWDGAALPVITFDPGDGSSANTGYRLVDNDGVRSVEKVVVNEAMARKEPVWVINRNDDSQYTSLEMLRRQDPDWGTGGGSVIVGKKLPSKTEGGNSGSGNQAVKTKAGEDGVKTLILKDFTMLRNYDSWFAGASEFFVKCGAVEDFSASTEAELRLYSPAVTDFMIVVKRSYVGRAKPFNAVLVSQLTDQIESLAFMITEDDGGTRTTWNCEAKVMIKSKSYGFDISIPFNTRDDIVWRGQLTRKYIEKYDGQSCRFGDVNLTFELVE